MTSVREKINELMPWDTNKVPFHERPPVNRDSLPAFVRGYLDSILHGLDYKQDGGFSFLKYDCFTERTIQQILRDCAYFTHRNRKLLYRARHDKMQGISSYSAGWCFWESRTGTEGNFRTYRAYLPEVSKLLHESAVGFGPVWVVTDDEGQLDYVWEEPYEFDFT